jgi:hypothetical protein
MTGSRSLLGFLALVVAILALSMAITVWFDLDGPAAFFGSCGLLFLVAAGGRPAIVYEIVRNTDWFAEIHDDRAMRLILLLLGLALIGISPLFLHIPKAAG